MTRWEPDAGDRLQKAAMGLYLQRGYDDVTVAEIAQAAGLTKRTFFRHFVDKREVLFAGAPAFEADVVAAVTGAAEGIPPLDAVVSALTDTGAGLARYGQYGRVRRDLIASSPDLQERDRTKTASLTAGIARELQHRGLDPLQASLTAQAGVAVFTTAYDRWMDDPSDDLATHVDRSSAVLRRAVSTT